MAHFNNQNGPLIFPALQRIALPANPERHNNTFTSQLYSSYAFKCHVRVDLNHCIHAVDELDRACSSADCCVHDAASLSRRCSWRRSDCELDVRSILLRCTLKDRKSVV